MEHVVSDGLVTVRKVTQRAALDPAGCTTRLEDGYTVAPSFIISVVDAGSSHCSVLAAVAAEADGVHVVRRRAQATRGVDWWDIGVGRKIEPTRRVRPTTTRGTAERVHSREARGRSYPRGRLVGPDWGRGFGRRRHHTAHNTCVHTLVEKVEIWRR